MESPSLADCTGFIRTWREECIANHARCRELSTARGYEEGRFTPTRLVDVGSQDTAPYVYEHRRSGPLGGPPPAYVALSHCWGRSPIIRTTKAAYEEHQRAIPWSHLSKTFQDAITITRELGIGYIWIDSLCIVQDDDEDWEREAVQMAQVYQGAFVTLASTSAPGGEAGMLNQQSRTEKVVVDGGGKPSTVYARRAIDHRGFFRPGEPSERNLPLLGRGWTFQEQLLSPRIVHFTEEELIWDCYEGLFCECGNGKDWFVSKSDFARALLEPSTQSRTWRGLVSHYIGRVLTYDKDRLPAISSLAGQLEASSGLGRYLAGLWEADLPFNLLWRVEAGTGRRPSYRDARGMQPPTWSWTSIECPTLAWAWSEHDDDPEAQAEVLEVSCRPATSDPRGMVLGGQLVLRSRLYPVVLQSVHEPRWVYLRSYNQLQGSKTVCSIKPDVPLGSPGMDIDEGEMLFFLPISGRPDWNWYHGLLLRCVGDRDSSLPSRSGGSHIDFHCRRLGCGTIDFRETRQIFDDKVVLIT
jgi:hypothetical protein